MLKASTFKQIKLPPNESHFEQIDTFKIHDIVWICDDTGSWFIFKSVLRVNCAELIGTEIKFSDNLPLPGTRLNIINVSKLPANLLERWKRKSKFWGLKNVNWVMFVLYGSGGSSFTIHKMILFYCEWRQRQE